MDFSTFKTELLDEFNESSYDSTKLGRIINRVQDQILRKNRFPIFQKSWCFNTQVGVELYKEPPDLSRIEQVAVLPTGTGVDNKVVTPASETFAGEVFNNSTSEQLGQSFKFSSTKRLTSINCYMRALGTLSGDIVAEIQTSSSGLPSGNLVPGGISNRVRLEVVDSSPTWLSFDFPYVPQLTADTLYWIVLKPSGYTYLGGVTTLYWGDNSDTVDRYTDGSAAYKDSGGTWHDFASYVDFIFGAWEYVKPSAAVKYWDKPLFDQAILVNDSTSTTGEPKIYTRWGGKIFFFPFPDAVYPILIDGYKKLGQLTQSSDTNELLENAHDLFLYACAVDLARHLGETEAKAEFQEKFAEELKQFTDDEVERGMGSFEHRDMRFQEGR